MNDSVNEIVFISESETILPISRKYRKDIAAVIHDIIPEISNTEHVKYEMYIKQIMKQISVFGSSLNLLTLIKIAALAPNIVPIIKDAIKQVIR